MTDYAGVLARAAAGITHHEGRLNYIHRGVCHSGAIRSGVSIEAFTSACNDYIYIYIYVVQQQDGLPFRELLKLVSL